MRDSSLDEFLSGTGEEPGEDEPTSEREADTVRTDAESEPEPEPEPEVEDGKGSDADAETDTAGPPPVEAVEPARSTYAWSPDGAACADCGERVEERWESDSGLVCVECKRW